MQEQSTKIQDLIMEVISGETRPIPHGVLLSKVSKKYHIQSRTFVKDFNRALNELVDSYQVKKLLSNKYVLGYVNGPIDKSTKYVGTIAINDKHCGFVTVDGADKSQFYVFRTNLNGALDGDRVEIYRMIKDQTKELADAVVGRVIEHTKEFYVCIFRLHPDKKYEIIADASNLYLPIKLDDITGLVDGQKILVQITHFEKDKLFGTVSRILGHKDDVGVDILSIVLDKGVNPDFDPELLEDTKKIKFEINDYQKKIRTDLRDKNIVTIDPKTSKDFDDAFYIEKIDDKNYRLYVAIADVAYYVPYQSALDDVAKKRGTSIYLVDRVIPMLPHILSDDVCSLMPHQDRFATCCEMEINDKAKFTSIKVYPAIINSKRRFNYDEVNEYFQGKNKFEKDTKTTKDMLNVARELHKILEKNKYQRGYINFNIPEVEIELDKNGFPENIKVKKLGETQHLIENFMLAANEAVTLYADKHNIPFVYRIHDKPNAEKIKSLVIETKKLNFKVNTDLDNIQPQDVAKWFKDNADNPNLDLIEILILRAMAKAAYSTTNIGHFGLALENYTHYTSPIRRYPDLMVGRLFWMYQFDSKNYTNEQRQQFANELEELCELSSKNELIAIDCERSVNSMKFAEYMSRHIGENFIGFVSGVTKFGCFIELPNTIEGLARLNNLGDDYFIYNDDIKEIIGKKTAIRFTMGSKVEVQVIEANKDTQQVSFKVIKHLGNR